MCASCPVDPHKKAPVRTTGNRYYYSTGDTAEAIKTSVGFSIQMATTALVLFTETLSTGGAALVTYILSKVQ
jgi:hypothetical protein